MEPTHVVDPTDIALALNDFQLSIGTIDGRNKRPCPSCKKEFKVERLGEHVKKHHPEFWDALFTVETLEASIKNEELVKCTIAEGDHDQKFLICLACDSIRTTNRDHFKKNGKIHSDQHYEMATKMIAKKKGIAYQPKYKTDLETALALLDKYRRHRAECTRDHGDAINAISEMEDAQAELLKTKQELAETTKLLDKSVKISIYQKQLLANIYAGITNVSNGLPYTTGGFEKTVAALIALQKSAREGIVM